jgi:hypothetical protein
LLVIRASFRLNNIAAGTSCKRSPTFHSLPD